MHSGRVLRACAHVLTICDLCTTGTFYEGVMTQGYSSDATDDAVQVRKTLPKLYMVFVFFLEVVVEFWGLLGRVRAIRVK